MSGFADIHQHLLYGIDDGPRDFNGMTDMLHAAHKDGIESIIATPHAQPGIKPFPYQLYFQRLEEARAYCLEKGLPIQLYSGTEILYTPLAPQMVADGKILTLARSENVLVEFVPTVEFKTIEEAVKAFLRNGHIPILAHIERYNCLMRSNTNAYSLKKTFDISYQVNCSSIIGSKGFRADRMLRSLLDARLIDYVATDAHNITSRPCRMWNAYNKLLETVDDDYAKQLVGLA